MLEPATFNANNQIADPGWSYVRGNVVQEKSGATLAYDGENRQVAYCPNDSNYLNCTQTAGNGRTLYYYDGQGRRVETVAPDGTTKAFVYDAAGNLAAEYGAQAALACSTCYVTADHLGSTRVVTDQNGCAVWRQDYLPFGEAVLASSGNPRMNATGGGKCSTNGYLASAAPVRLQFTGKERDAETGLDFFGTRYMSSAQGRWASSDPSNLGVDFYLPQTWNRYNYGLNNPLAVADKNGLWPFYVHQNIIDEAFPGLSKQDLKTLKDASWNMDYAPGQQDPSKSYMHGMSDGGGTVFWGGGNDQHDRGEADKYIDQQVRAAQKGQAEWIAQGHTGLSPKALTAFGNALHTVTDRTSPAHQGEQPWANKPWWHYTTLGHFFNEAWRSSSQVQSSDTAARSLFLTTFGSSFDWIFFKNPCAQTSASDNQGNSTGWSGCQ